MEEVNGMIEIPGLLMDIMGEELDGGRSLPGLKIL
jgi:hypothetical protein